MSASASSNSLSTRAAFWLAIYLLIVVAPLGVLLLGGAPDGSGFRWDFALAIGYSALAMMGLQFALTARFKRATAPFGIDLIYYFHRYLASVAVALVLIHAAVLLFGFPQAAGGLAVWALPTHLLAGWIALLAFLLLIGSSLLRKGLRIEYDRWRRLHVVLAVIGLIAALTHVLGSASYLQAPWKHALWLGLGVFWLGLSLYVRLLRPLGLRRRPWQVVDVRKERGRSWTVAVEPVDPADPGLRFRAGQFAWLSLGVSPFAMREHPFSISSSPNHPRRLEFTIKELGDFTRTVARIETGTRACVDGPYGNFTTERADGASGLVFIAGGVGIAPVMSMLRWLSEQGDERPLWLFYGNRSFERVVFRAKLDVLRAGMDLHVVHVLGEPPPGWEGERGYITAEVLNRHLPGKRDRLAYFVCGPQPMIDLAERSLDELGVPLDRLHSELFDLA